MQDLTFIANDKDGKPQKFQAIATYNDEITKKDYIVYTDNTYDNNGKLKIYYSLYKMLNEKMHLIEITINEDRKVALELVRELISDN